MGAGIADAKGLHFEPAIAQGVRAAFKADRLAALGDPAVNIEPTLLMRRYEIADPASLGIDQPGMAFERGVDFQKPVILPDAVAVEFNLNDAETGVDVVE